MRTLSIALALSLSVPAFAAGKAAAHKDKKHAPAAAAASKVTVGILANMEAKAGKEGDLQAFVTGALPLAQKEKDTVQWFALKWGPTHFGIFDSFAADAGRSAHLNGEIAKALGAKAGELLAAAPSLEKADIIASDIKADAARTPVKVGIVALMEAKPGKEKDLEKFLQGAVPLVKKEPRTLHWYAIKLSASKFGIVDTFADDAGREAHLKGEVAKALMAKSNELLSKAPAIDKVEILAAKP